MPTIHASVRQLDHSASLADVRDHQLTIDRPEAKGGQDKGPMGGEALLMGLGGCFMSNLLAAAQARDIALSDARADIEGDLADAPPRYTAVRMRVSADCEPASELAKLVTIAERGCIVANTLRPAVELSVECVQT
ncbi:MAG: OsmC family protein [Gammaproteobacteria bacterium]|nr:OsmC family protein [Gammaproteobacteria bacterium]